MHEDRRELIVKFLSHEPEASEVAASVLSSCWEKYLLRAGVSADEAADSIQAELLLLWARGFPGGVDGDFIPKTARRCLGRIRDERRKWRRREALLKRFNFGRSDARVDPEGDKEEAPGTETGVSRIRASVVDDLSCLLLHSDEQPEGHGGDRSGEGILEPSIATRNCGSRKRVRRFRGRQRLKRALERLGDPHSSLTPALEDELLALGGGWPAADPRRCARVLLFYLDGGIQDDLARLLAADVPDRRNPNQSAISLAEPVVKRGVGRWQELLDLARATRSEVLVRKAKEFLDLAR